MVVGNCLAELRRETIKLRLRRGWSSHLERYTVPAVQSEVVRMLPEVLDHFYML